MQRRGHLIRNILPEEIHQMNAELAVALRVPGTDIGVEGRDGAGAKTEAPWVRIFSREMSPSAQSGYYVVFHFSRDGSAVFITIGCGSTTWRGGNLTNVSEAELSMRTAWARNIILEQFGKLQPFNDSMELGTTRPLPRQFERSTVCACRLSPAAMEEIQVRQLLVMAAGWLRCIYEAQRQGRDLSSGDAAELVIEYAVVPARARRGGQGIRLGPEEGRAVERWAMHLASMWLAERGFRVTDVSATHSFDLHAVNDGATYKVEVKGTTTDGTRSVLMTHREVALHRAEKGNTGLIIVSDIRLRRIGTEVIADGGVLWSELGWDIDAWDASPLAYKLTRREL
jgi:hypothetical protein